MLTPHLLQTSSFFPTALLYPFPPSFLLLKLSSPHLPSPFLFVLFFYPSPYQVLPSPFSSFMFFSPLYLCSLLFSLFSSFSFFFCSVHRFFSLLPVFFLPFLFLFFS